MPPTKKPVARKAPAKKAASRKPVDTDAPPPLSPADPARRQQPDPIVLSAQEGPTLSDRLAKWLPLVGVVLTLIIIPAAFNASSGIDAARRSDKITGCRAAANGKVTDANTEARRAELANEVLVNRFIEVVVTRDTAALADILPQLPVSRARIEAADAALVESNRNYQAAIALSQSDPDRFLELCEKGDYPEPRRAVVQ